MQLTVKAEKCSVAKRTILVPNDEACTTGQQVDGHILAGVANWAVVVNWAVEHGVLAAVRG